MPNTVGGMQNQGQCVRRPVPTGLVLLPYGNEAAQVHVAGAVPMDAAREGAQTRLSNSLRANVAVALLAPPSVWPHAIRIARTAGAKVTAVADTPVEGADLTVTSTSLAVMPVGFDARHVTGPFDFIGDVHGQLDALQRLVAELGYNDDLSHPEGRIPVFLGDLVDKGPHSVAVFEWVTAAVAAGRALCVSGNHEYKLLRRLRKAAEAGDLDQLREFGSPETSGAAQFGQLDNREERVERAIEMLARLPYHLLLDGGRIAAVHAAARPELLGAVPRNSRERETAKGWFLYGPSNHGERDADGYPKRIDWAADYTGDIEIVHGHTAEQAPRVTGNVVAVDTGAGQGRTLSAYSYPERTFTTVTV